MTDIIADMLTRIRNANQVKNENVEVIGNKKTLNIAKILKEEGYIVDYFKEENKNGDKLKIRLKYSESNERVIKGLKRISKPGLRVYAKNNELPKVLNGLGIAIISTSKGMMTDKKARELNLGGEVLAFVW